jgi:uncharacterized small protein (DUF1192 family)
LAECKFASTYLDYERSEYADYDCDSVSKHEVEDINKRIAYLRIVVSQLSATCNDKGNEIAYLQNEIQQLEGYLSGLRNNCQQQKLESETYG